MKGDFTRSTFDPNKHYTSVRLQQGRVPMDADWNEAQDIIQRQGTHSRTDIIGRCGFPEDNAGFGLIGNVPTDTLEFSAGRGYVNGLICVNDATVSLSEQPYLPGATQPEASGFYLVYLDVWERHITALDDPNIKETALGGPDTATRTQTIWQIKLAPITPTDDAAPPNCADYGAGWQPPERQGSSRLRARAELDETSDRPCIIPAQAGYRRLENQLYRVEVHTGGTAETATFKWSRDNGSVVSAWNGPDSADTRLTVTTVGRDNVLRFTAEDWVELVSDTSELNGEPGLLAKVVTAEGQLLDIDRSVNRTDFQGHPKIRRWDHPSETGAIPIEEGRWLTLESGVQVWFEPESTYHTGDYWLIPARTIGATVLWPQNDGDGTPALVPPEGIEHHYCSLGIARRSANGQWEQWQDCRPLFPPLTNLPLNTQACGEIAVSPDDDLQSVINRIPAGSSVRLCLHPGVWQLESSVIVANKGHIVVSGAGEGTQLFGQGIDSCLLFRNCEHVSIRDLQVRGGNAGAIGDGLRGALSFLDCGKVTLENLRLTCNSFLSRRVSVVQISAQSQLPPTDVYIRQCHMVVGHQQTGLLIVNGGHINIASNQIETPPQPFNLSGVLANAQDPALVAAVGNHLMRQIVVGNDNLPEDASEVLVGGPVGLLAGRNQNGQHRILADLIEWGEPFAFYTDARLNPRFWRTILEANPIRSQGGTRLSPGVVGTRLRQLRSRLVRRIFGNTTVEINLPSAGIFGTITEEIERSNRLTTGAQGIVIAGDRTPFFGSNEPFANGLFITDGSLAPTATLTHNHITGFAEGIHIGHSTRSRTNSRAHRSYHLRLEGNTIQLRAASLAAARHGIFVGNAHSVTIQGNTIQLTEPTPRQWQLDDGNDNNRLLGIPLTDGIHLTGVYGPLLSIQQNHCIGVTRGIAVTARHAGNHEARFGIMPAWHIADNAYAGLGTAQELASTPSDRF